MKKNKHATHAYKSNSEKDIIRENKKKKAIINFYMFISAYVILPRKVLSKVRVLHLKVNLTSLQNIHTFKAKKISISLYTFWA